MPTDRIIDIYWGNDRIDLDFASANDVKAVICKATEGINLPGNQQDAAYYPRLKAKARSLNILWGAYHLTSDAAPASQLAHFLSVEDGSDPNIVMAIDWETANDGTALDLDGLRELVRLFALRFQGRYPVLYGGSKIRDHQDEIAGDELLGACPLWYQQYSPHSGPLPPGAMPLHFPIGPWKKYALWQYSDEHGSLYGAPDFPQLEGADWNRFDGDAAALQAAWPFSLSNTQVSGTGTSPASTAPSRILTPSAAADASGRSNGAVDYLALWQGKRGGDAHVKVIGVRGAYEPGGQNKLGIYDDDFVLIIGDVVTEWKGSTDPGQYFINHPENPNGCAQLKEGIHMFKAGIHRGIYPAFVQAEDFHVNRLDHQGNVHSVDFGDFGIHLHSGGPGIDVGQFSAGCQVIWCPEGYFKDTWHRFFDPAVEAMRASGQSLLPYMLLDESDLAPNGATAAS